MIIFYDSGQFRNGDYLLEIYDSYNRMPDYTFRLEILLHNFFPATQKKLKQLVNVMWDYQDGSELDFDCYIDELIYVCEHLKAANTEDPKLQKKLDKNMDYLYKQIRN